MLQRLLTFSIAAGFALTPGAFAQGWQKGKGYGWTFGPNDERGAINTVNDPSKILAALK